MSKFILNERGRRQELTQKFYNELLDALIRMEIDIDYLTMLLNETKDKVEREKIKMSMTSTMEKIDMRNKVLKLVAQELEELFNV